VSRSKAPAPCLPASCFDFVRLLPDRDAEMKFLENHWASITCDRSRTRTEAPAGIVRDKGRPGAQGSTPAAQ